MRQRAGGRAVARSAGELRRGEVFGVADAAVDDRCDRDALATTRRRFADAGLALLGIEGDRFDMADLKLGGPTRDATMQRYARMLANMGELGLGLLCYKFMARPAGQARDRSRTRTDLPIRSGAPTTAFDLADVPTASGCWRGPSGPCRGVLRPQPSSQPLE